MDCTIRLAQVQPSLGDLERNLALHHAAIDEAVAAGVQVLVFPELSLTGYFLKDQTADAALRLDAPELRSLAERSGEVSIAVGFIERDPSGRLYNSIGFFEDGLLLGVHRKVHLCTYGMFEEGRDWAPGDRFRPIASKHGLLGFLICEDMWHLDGAYLYFVDGVDAIVCCSASPARGVAESARGADGPELESNQVWRHLHEGLALYTRTWILYANRVGWEDGVLFGGASRAIDPFGAEAGRLEGLDPGHLDVPVTDGALQRARVSTPLRRDANPHLFLRELQRRLEIEGED